MTRSDSPAPNWRTEDFGRSPPGIATALEGYVCHALLVQQCWLSEELVEPANVIFVQCGSDRWVRFYVDGGDLGWGIDSELRAIDPQPIDSGSELRYPILDVGAKFGVIGQRISHVNFVALEPAPAGKLVLSFGNGRRLALINEADTSRFELLTSTA